MRLRTVSCQEPGWRRLKHGTGFRYVDTDGDPLGAADRQRARDLVIPPAWTDVWICPHPRGHLQAVGTDEAGRRQYLYHPEWRVQQDLEKFDRVLALAARLPGVRRKLRNQLRAAPGDEETERRRALALAVRLIDLGCFRPGSDAATEEHGSHGLTTLERRHVRLEGEEVVFRFVGKSEVEHEIRVDDPDVRTVIGRLCAHRRSGARVLASKVGGRWRPISPEEVNEHVREVTGLEVTAKDLRTWGATVAAAVTLATVPPAESARARKQQVQQAVEAAADLLGNTPTVARSSYVDPRAIDLFEDGRVLDPVPAGPDALDRAVAHLLAHG